MAHKVYINRLRRMAKRQGLQMRKSRTRDPRAITFNQFSIRTAKGRTIVLATDPARIEQFLVGEAR